MPPRIEDDWSDSEDDESGSDLETSVLLGIPDGEIQDSSDLSDPSVSRIGGLPVFLPTRPFSSSNSQCTLCGHPMPLLVQMWCPFEGSAMDRALYVWGCERPGCQHKDGSIRVWRGLKFNPTYAAKLAKKKARETENLARKAADRAGKNEEEKNRSLNPFSLSAGTSNEVFGLGTQLFGSDPTSSHENSNVIEEELSASGSDSEDQGQDKIPIDAVAEHLVSATLESPALSPEWSSSPAYNPIYLSTISEYLPPPVKSHIKPQSSFDPDVEDNKTGAKDWELEGWEKSEDVDPIFDKFVKRVSNENEQCVRYDLKGTPLPFGSRDKIFGRLWPSPPPPPFTTKPGFAAPIIQRRIYDTSSIEKCGKCGSPRIFECQLMPNLINVLRAQEQRNTAEKQKSVNRPHESPQTQAQEVQTKNLEAKLNAGMEWGTCFIFSCEKDCCDDKAGWREELVLVQWDE